jgi:hypothetical protein
MGECAHGDSFLGRRNVKSPSKAEGLGRNEHEI